MYTLLLDNVFTYECNFAKCGLSNNVLSSWNSKWRYSLAIGAFSQHLRHEPPVHELASRHPPSPATDTSVSAQPHHAASLLQSLFISYILGSIYSEICTIESSSLLTVAFLSENLRDRYYSSNTWYKIKWRQARGDRRTKHPSIVTTPPTSRVIRPRYMSQSKLWLTSTRSEGKCKIFLKFKGIKQFIILTFPENTPFWYFSPRCRSHQSLMQEESSPTLERDDGCVAKNRYKNDKTRLALSEKRSDFIFTNVTRVDIDIQFLRLNEMSFCIFKIKLLHKINKLCY